MTAAIVEFTRMDPVSGVVIWSGASADEDIHGRKAGIGRHFVQVNVASANFDARLGMSQVEIGS